MSVTVASGATTQVAFNVTCVAKAILQIAVVTTGTGAPEEYGVRFIRILGIDAFWRPVGSIPANGTVSFAVSPGSYGVNLTVPLNCTVARARVGERCLRGNHPCGLLRDLRSPREASGDGGDHRSQRPADAFARCGSDSRHPGPAFRYSVAVPSNGVTLTNVLPVGDHVARLDVLDGCTVTSPNPVTVTLTSGATTDLGFTVACP